MTERTPRVLVRGALIALERDDEDRAEQVLLVTDEGLEFLVENTAVGRLLAEHVDSDVEVLGVVDELDDGTLTLRPASFRETGFDDDAATDWVQSWRARTR